MGRKYEFTGEVKEHNGRKLQRIRAVRDIANNGKIIVAGTLGGWIEKEDNLSHNDGAWVADFAHVYEFATVIDDALVKDASNVYGCAKISGNAMVCLDACVHGNATIADHAVADHNANVYGYAKLRDRAFVGTAANVYDTAIITGNAIISAYASCYGNCTISGNTFISGAAKVFGDVTISGHARFYAGEISTSMDYICIGPIGSRLAYVTFTRSFVATGCFLGSYDDFTSAVNAKYGTNHEYHDAVAFAEAVFAKRGSI